MKVSFNALNKAKVKFYQWDYGQKLEFTEHFDNAEIHYPLPSQSELAVVRVENDEAIIPTSTLTLNQEHFNAYLYIDRGTEGKTKKTIEFELVQRPMPEGHIYDPSDDAMYDINYIVETAKEAVRKAKEAVDTIDISGERLYDGVRITVTNVDGSTQQFIVYDGKDGTSADALVVNYIIGSSEITADKTYTEIVSAYQDGTPITAKICDEGIELIANSLRIAGNNIVFEICVFENGTIQLFLNHSSEDVISINTVEMQEKLIAGTNIKNINGTSLLDSGNLKTFYTFDFDITVNAQGQFSATARQGTTYEAITEALAITSDVFFVGHLSWISNKTVYLFATDKVPNIVAATGMLRVSESWFNGFAGGYLTINSNNQVTITVTPLAPNEELTNKVDISQGLTNANKLVVTDGNGDINTFTDIPTLTGRKPLNLSDTFTNPTTLADGSYDVVTGGYIGSTITNRILVAEGSILRLYDNSLYYIDSNGSSAWIEDVTANPDYTSVNMYYTTLSEVKNYVDDVIGDIDTALTTIVSGGGVNGNS